MKITHQQILDAAPLLEVLGRYTFGRKLRYAIHYNTPKIAAQVKVTMATRADIFNAHGWQLDKPLNRFIPGFGAKTTELERVLAAFLAEEEEVDLRTVVFADTGETEFPPNTLPGWMMPMEVVEEVATTEPEAKNGQVKEDKKPIPA